MSSLAWRTPLTRGLLLLMETLWIYALLASLIALGSEESPFSPFGVGAVVIASYVISRGLQQSEMELGIIRVWGVLLSLLLFYAIVRVEVFDSFRFWDFGWSDELVADIGKATTGQGPAVVATVLLGAVWMRGLLRGQESLSFESIVKTFAIGVAAFAAILLLARAVDAPATVGAVAVPYIAIGLLTIGLTHASREQADAERPFSLPALLAVSGAVLVLSGIALVFVLLDFGALANALGTAAGAGGQVILWVLWPVGWIATQAAIGLLEFIQWLVGEREPFTPDTPPPATDGEGNQTILRLPDWLADALRSALVVAVFALIVGFIALAFRRRRKGAGERGTNESLHEEGRLSGDLVGLVDSLLGKLRPGFGFGSKLDPVRRLYADLLEAAEKRGVRRDPSRTPSELVPELEALFASSAPARITAAFNDLRYGGIAPEAGELQALREAWDAARKGTT